MNKVMKIEVGNIIKIKNVYFEVTGTKLLEPYGMIEVISLNCDTAEEVRINIESIELVWKLESDFTSKLEKIKDELSDEWIKEYLNNHPSPEQREDSKLNKKEYSLMSVSVDAAFISASKWMRDEILNRLK